MFQRVSFEMDVSELGTFGNNLDPKTGPGSPGTLRAEQTCLAFTTQVANWTEPELVGNRPGKH